MNIGKEDKETTVFPNPMRKPVPDFAPKREPVRVPATPRKGELSIVMAPVEVGCPKCHSPSVLGVSGTGDLLTAMCPKHGKVSLDKVLDKALSSALSRSLKLPSTRRSR